MPSLASALPFKCQYLCRIFCSHESWYQSKWHQRTVKAMELPTREQWHHLLVLEGCLQALSHTETPCYPQSSEDEPVRSHLFCFNSNTFLSLVCLFNVYLGHMSWATKATTTTTTTASHWLRQASPTLKTPPAQWNHGFVNNIDL